MLDAQVGNDPGISEQVLSLPFFCSLYMPTEPSPSEQSRTADYECTFNSGTPSSLPISTSPLALSLFQLAYTIPDCAVANLAADGYTSADTLHGSDRVISVGMRDRLGDPVPFDEDGKFRLLSCMELT